MSSRSARAAVQLGRAARSLRAGLATARREAMGNPDDAARADASAPAPVEGVNYARVEQIVRTVAEEIWQRRSDLNVALQDIALRDSARFVLDNIPLHLGKTHYELRRDAVLAAPEGLFMEFGVWKGSWLRQMAEVRDVQFYGFDSFEGLPESWSLYKAGMFDLEGDLPEMPDSVTLVKGWFSESLPPFLAEHAGPVAFVHIDCDLYASTRTVLSLLADRFVAGTQIVLDDFMYMPGWQREEHRAFFEFVEEHKWRFEFTGYSSDFPACSAGVRLLDRG